VQISDAMAVRYGLPDWPALPTLDQVSASVANDDVQSAELSK